MSETNKDALANISALFELDKARFRSLTIDVREARRRADDLLAKITVIKDAFVAAELQKGYTYRDTLVRPSMVSVVQ